MRVIGLEAYHSHLTGNCEIKPLFKNNTSIAFFRINKRKRSIILKKEFYKKYCDIEVAYYWMRNSKMENRNIKHKKNKAIPKIVLNFFYVSL